jgi:hypothetical protein
MYRADVSLWEGGEELEALERFAVSEGLRVGFRFRCDSCIGKGVEDLVLL